MAYEIWDFETNNLLGAYETEDDALAAVRDALDEHGVGYVETLVLGYENKRGRSRTIAAGAALVDRIVTRERAMTAATHQNLTSQPAGSSS